jgi:hypothetical protein
LKQVFLIFTVLFILTSPTISQQVPFSGELVYKVQRVDKLDSTFSQVLIYAKDSILKVVSFSELQGRQELIKHLRLQKSYLLVEINGQKLAIRTNEHLQKDASEANNFQPKRGTKRIAGLKCHKMIWKHPSLSEPLTFYYHKKISAKYANVYTELPGLPVLYFLPTEDGLYRYQLIEIKHTTPPISLFLIPQEYRRISFDELNEVLGAGE